MFSGLSFVFVISGIYNEMRHYHIQIPPDFDRHKGRAVVWWLRHYATNRQVAVSIPDGVIGIFQ
jgi:hypothetical protein